MALERPTYSDEAAKRILQKAMDLQLREQDTSFSRDQLAEMASELGISQDALVKAEQQWMAEQETSQEREAEQAEVQAFKRDRRQAFKGHLIAYICVNLMLFFINLSTSGFSDGEIWFIYPLMGWGIGLAMHAWNVSQTEGQMFDAEYQTWRKTRQITGKTTHKLHS